MILQNKRMGVLCVVSGPSGSGKTTLCRGASAAGGGYYSVSCTTRARRDGEVHGQDYFFLEEAAFLRRVEAGEFLEHALVHGRHYGTLKSEVLPRLHRGEDVIMDLDTQGAAMLRACQDPEICRSLMDVFLLPPDAEEFRRRLAARRSETPQQIDTRLRNAREEMRHWREYDYAIVSGTREDDLRALQHILAAERLRASRLVAAGADTI
ncbi:MAG: guanylate kinase [Verrucomicrobiales bacterium]|nr:guanylate kinase [Verrucomicrobiales bacterium]